MQTSPSADGGWVATGDGVRYNVTWAMAPSGMTFDAQPSGTVEIADPTKRRSHIQPDQRKNVLYMYLDESGDFNFAESGTKYFIMTCVVTRRPFLAASELTELRHDLVESMDIATESFHACEDTNRVREMVFSRIVGHSSEFSAYSIRLDKRSLPEDERNARSVYYKVFECIVSEVHKSEDTDDVDLVVAITDDLPTAAKKSNVVAPLKKFMNRFFSDRGTRYVLLHQKSCSDSNLQIADYLCWAYQKKFVHNGEWPYSLVSDIFREVGEASFPERK